MTRKRSSEEAALDFLRQIDLDLASGSTVETAIRTAGISEATYYKWRKLYGGMGQSQLRELKAMEKENARLKRIVAELELGKLILKESLDYLKPKASRLLICVRLWSVFAKSSIRRRDEPAKRSAWRGAVCATKQHQRMMTNSAWH